MRTLFVAYRVSSLQRSLGFYMTLGYRELGQVAFDDGGRLAVLSFPDEPVGTLELVHRPGAAPVEVRGFDHLAIQVDDLTSTCRCSPATVSTPDRSSPRAALTALGRPG